MGRGGGLAVLAARGPGAGPITADVMSDTGALASPLSIEEWTIL